MSQKIIFTYENGRYLKWTLLILLLVTGAYIWDTPAIKPNGGTILGYGLGTLGALLILWLMLLGVRKRAYKSNVGTVRGWVSAHVYLGLALIIIATLHTGFEFGWNVHTLAYTLMMIVIVSGIWGVAIYSLNPTLMGQTLRGKTLEELGGELRDLDRQAQTLAAELDQSTQRMVEELRDGKVFQNAWQRFSGKNAKCLTRAALLTLSQQQSNTSADDHASAKQQDLYTLILRRYEQLKRIRQYVKLKSWVECWLLIHVPLSFALLACLTAHIVSVFFYW